MGEVRSETCDVLLVGPLPPPMNGMTVMTAAALGVSKGAAVCVRHFDISDHRHIENVGRLDLQNVLLALSQAAGLYRASRRYRPRLVVLPIAQSNLGFLRDAALFLAVRNGGAKPLIYLHGAAFSTFSSEAHPLVRWIIKVCFRTVAGGFVLTASLRHMFGRLIEPDHVWVVPNGISEDTRVFRSKQRRDCVNVLFLSNLSIAKGYRDTLMAAVLIARIRTDIRFVFAGAWPRRDEERWALGMVRANGLQGNVEFRGQVVGLRKAQLYEKADIFCFTPRYPEGQPVVVLEAMRAGIPCIVTKQGGIVDTVIDGVTGIWVNTDSPDSIAGAILKLANDGGLRERMGADARRRYDDNYTERHYHDSLMTSLQAALIGAPAGSHATAAPGEID